MIRSIICLLIPLAGSASPRFVRCTTYNLPATSDMAKTCQVICLHRCAAVLSSWIFIAFEYSQSRYWGELLNLINFLIADCTSACIFFDGRTCCRKLKTIEMMKKLIYWFAEESVRIFLVASVNKVLLVICCICLLIIYLKQQVSV